MKHRQLMKALSAVIQLAIMISRIHKVFVETWLVSLTERSCIRGMLPLRHPQSQTKKITHFHVVLEPGMYRLTLTSVTVITKTGFELVE